MPSANPTTHIVLFPFMSKGHTIPIIDLAHVLLSRNISTTIFTTPANRPFVAKSLSNTNINIIEIPFPQNVEGIPQGIESTDTLPSMSLFGTFANATKFMKPHFEEALASILPITFMITDGFLGWTLDSANKYDIPRLAHYGMSTFGFSLIRSSYSLLLTEFSDNEPFAVPDFPWIKLTKNDLPFTEIEPNSPFLKFTMENDTATSKSYGLLVNSFYELESVYVDYNNSKCSPTAWCIGPFCAAIEPQKLAQSETSLEKPSYIEWLDEMLEQGKSVLYVAFGTQAEISFEQYKEIIIWLENSEVNFLWVVRRSNTISEVNEGFEKRVKTKGLVVKEWVDQREILKHKSIKGFLNHCGWNSVLESICAKVPILAWPMMADQYINARMVVEEIKIGQRVETCDGSVRGFVKWQGLEKPAKELMEGDIGREARKKVNELGEAATNAVKQGGSSWNALNDLILELTTTRKVPSCDDTISCFQ